LFILLPGVIRLTKPKLNSEQKAEDIFITLVFAMLAAV